jgi:hypothetical protein
MFNDMLATGFAVLAFWTSPTAHAGDFTCYDGRSSDLSVCISDLAPSSGDGYSVLVGRGVAQRFTWDRTTRNILFTEVDRNTGAATGCTSGVTITGRVMTVLNYSDECGIPSGEYIRS